MKSSQRPEGSMGPRAFIIILKKKEEEEEEEEESKWR